MCSIFEIAKNKKRLWPNEITSARKRVSIVSKNRGKCMHVQCKSKPAVCSELHSVLLLLSSD